MNIITVTGNLTDEPQLKFTQSGKPITEFTVAVSQGKDKDAFFLDCEVWHEDITENVAELKKGNRVSLTGRLKEDKWEYEGKKYKKFVLTCQDVAVSCRWQKVTAERIVKT